MTSKSILMVDDDPTSLEIFRLVLAHAGYKVYSAQNGAEAMTVLLHTGIDLLVTDLYMPGKEGIELIRDIRRENKHLKIIAISGGMSSPLDVSNLLHICQTLGADCTLQKPVAGDVLCAKIRELLQEKS